MKKLLSIMLLSLMLLVPEGASAKYNIMDHLSDRNNQWINNDNNWYYVIDNELVKGIKTINGKIYYFDDNGKMASNQWSNINNNWIYSISDGRLVKGWNYINRKWYFFDSNYNMVHDNYIDGYYLGSDGAWVE